MPRRVKQPAPTVEDLRNNREEAAAKFGRDSQLGYANVSMTQLSIARYYGGCKVNGKHFVYNPLDDSLLREDVVEWLIEKREEADAKKD